MMKFLALLLFVPAILAVPTDDKCKEVAKDRFTCAKDNVKSIFVKALGMKPEFDLRDAIKVGYNCLKDNGCRIPTGIKPKVFEKQIHKQVADFAHQAWAHQARIYNYLEKDLGWTEGNPFKDNEELKQCIKDESKKSADDVLDACVPDNLRDILTKRRRHHRGGRGGHGGGRRHHKGGHHGHYGQVMKILSMAEKFNDMLERICEKDKIPDVFVCVKEKTGVDATKIVRKRDEVRLAACDVNDKCQKEIETKHGAGIEKECIDSKQEKVRKFAVEKCECVKENVLPYIKKCSSKIPNFQMPKLAELTCDQYEEDMLGALRDLKKKKRLDVCAAEFNWDEWKEFFHPKK